MSNESAETDRRDDIANCYRICRNFQDRGAKFVLNKLRECFPEKTDAEIMELIIEVEKLTAENSKSIGC